MQQFMRGAHGRGANRSGNKNISIMAKKTTKSRIQDAAIGILSKRPEGMRYSELQRAIHEQEASFNLNSISGTLYTLHELCDEVEKPSRGLYRIRGTEHKSDTTKSLSRKERTEDQFYQPFADFLKGELEDVTKAIPLGGNLFRDKWGTPDVIGKKDSKPSDIVKLPIEIVSAEIKIDTNQLVTAFGQACAYCLFSHRSYLVVPKQAVPEELSRLDSLCQVFGIGLVLFDAENPDEPMFEIRTRPKKQEPDSHYINKYMKSIERELFL